MKNYPKVSDADIAFGAYPKHWFKKAVIEARSSGFDMNNCDRAAGLFFSGGKVNFDQSLDHDFLERGYRILRAVLGSYDPKHGEKMAVCELIINSLEIKKD